MESERWLRVIARLESIEQVREFVSEAAASAGLDEHGIYHCEMAVDETVTNIIEHGYDGGNADAQIDVQCAVENARFIITIADDSPPFNPLTLENPDPRMTLDERKPGGWGIFFVKKMMDEVYYAYQGGRNYLTMVKRLPVVEPAGGGDMDEMGRREVAPEVWALAPTGRLDSLSSPPFEAALKAELEAGHANLIVDMSRVFYMSSSGLKSLVSAWRMAKKIGGEIALVGLQPRVAEVFQMVGFDQVFRIFATVEQALDAIRQQEGRQS